MSIKRNGGIIFISAFGFSATFCRKAGAPKPRLSRNPVTRVRQIMAQEEASVLRPMLAISSFASSAAFFLAAIATIV